MEYLVLHIFISLRMFTSPDWNFSISRNVTPRVEIKISSKDRKIHTKLMIKNSKSFHFKLDVERDVWSSDLGSKSPETNIYERQIRLLFHSSSRYCGDRRRRIRTGEEARGYFLLVQSRGRRTDLSIRSALRSANGKKNGERDRRDRWIYSNGHKSALWTLVNAKRGKIEGY